MSIRDTLRGQFLVRVLIIYNLSISNPLERVFEANRSMTTTGALWVGYLNEVQHRPRFRKSLDFWTPDLFLSRFF